MPHLKVKITLDHLVCHSHQKGWKKGTEPYIWTIFFKADGTCLSITPEFKLHGKVFFQTNEGSHGNLGAGKIPEGTIVKIPPEHGEWQTELHEIILPYFEAPVSSVCGVVMVVMEENNLSAKGAEAAHKFLNEWVENAVREVVRGFDPRKIQIRNIEESLKNYFTSRLTGMALNIDKDLRQAVIKSQNLLENIWSAIDSDTLIGYAVQAFSQWDIEEAGTVTFSQRWKTEKGGDWEIFGEVAAM